MVKHVLRLLATVLLGSYLVSLAACTQTAPESTPPPAPTAVSTLAPAATPTAPPARPSVEPTAVSPTATAAATITPLAPSAQPAVPLALRWFYPTTSPPLALDLYSLDGGPLPDLLFGTRNGRLVTLAQDGSEYWRTVHSAAVTALLGADLDEDNAGDVITGNNAGVVSVVEGGETRWTYQADGPVTTLLLWEDSPDPLLLVAAGRGALTGLDQEGIVQWQAALGTTVTAALRADVNGDGVADAVVAGRDGSMLALTPQGSELWRARLPGAALQIAAPDVNGDGAAEVVAGTGGGQVLALTSTGILLWQQSLGGAVSALHAADLNGDGTPELLAGSGGAEGVLTALAADGRFLWQQALGGPGLWRIATTDLEGDARPEILAGSDDGQVRVLDENGRLRAAFPLGSPVYDLVAADVVQGPDSPQPELVARTAAGIYLLDTQGNGRHAPSLPAPPVTAAPSADLLPAAGVTLLALGDLSLGPPLAQRAFLHGPNYLTGGVQPLLQAADLVVFHLAEPLVADGTPAARPFITAAPPYLAPLLHGMDVAFLANAHMLDWGLPGLEETVALLQEQGIVGVGAGATPETAVAAHLLQIDGLNFAFLSFTDAAPGPGVASADPATITPAVAAAAPTVDFVIVALHTAGATPRVTQSQRAAARAAVDAGASLVIGYGPEQMLETELYNGGYIVYALGHFAPRAAAGTGALLRATFTAEGLRPPELLLTAAADGWQPQLAAAADGGVARSTEFPPVAPAAASGEPDDYPHYAIDVDLDYAGHTAAVSQTVKLTNNSEADWAEVVFHAAPAFWGTMFTLEEAAVDLDGVMETAVVNRENTMLRVQMPRLVVPGESLALTFRYRLSLPRLDPIGWGPEGNAGWSADLVQMGDWYPALVPFAGGTWQTWEYWPVGDPVISPQANFDVYIRSDTELLLAAPGFVNVTETGRRHYRLQGARAFSFLASPDYVSFTGDAGGIPVQVYVTDDYRALGPVVLNAAAQALNLFQDLYGPYPYPELIIAENGFLTAIEYSAIVSLSGFAFDAYEGTAESLLVAITAHEVAHQWWYGGVGNDQVTEPWLDESLAMMSELLFYEHYYAGSVDWWWQYRVDRWEPAGPVDVTIYEYETSEAFVHDMYGQGAYFMADLRATMGEAEFRTLLRAYYEQFRGQLAQGSDFLALAQANTAVELGPLIDLYFRGDGQ